MDLRPYVEGWIWLADYDVRLGGTRFEARMTVARRSDGSLVVHSPAPLDETLRSRLAALGRVAVIVAPGNFHHLHVTAFQRAFPGAQTWICPGVERKQRTLRYDGILTSTPPAVLADDFVLAPVVGRVMSEVAMLHRPSRTLLLVDLVENFGDTTPRLSRSLEAWWKLFGMWNHAVLAPEYRFAGFSDRAATRAAMTRILAWDFERMVIAHGDLVTGDAHAIARHAWRALLAAR